MLTACPLGGFPWWSYLFDDRTKILMAMEMSVAYRLGNSPDRMIRNVQIDKYMTSVKGS